MATPLYTRDDLDLGIQVNVWLNPKGFLVNLRDTDADEVFPSAKIFPNLDDAKKFADKIINGPQKGATVWVDCL